MRQSIRSKLLFVLMLVGVAGVGLSLFHNWHFTSWDFRNNLWGPTYLLVHGQSPYHIATLFDRSNSVWFPMVIGALFPLGLLPETQATQLWFMVNVTAVFFIFWQGAATRHPPLLRFGISLLAICLFPSTVATIRLGQFSLLAAALFLATIPLLERQAVLWLGLLLTLVLAKPQLSFLVLPGLGLASWQHHGFEMVGRLVLAIVLWSGLLMLPLFIAYPTWWTDFIAALQTNPTWFQPSLYSLLPLYIGNTGLFLAGLVSIALFGLNAWLWLRFPTTDALPWSLALTPIATPYIWSYDFVFLLPLLIRTAFRLRSIGAQVVLWLGYGLCWVLSVYLLAQGVSNYRLWWMPWALFLTIGAAYLADKQMMRPTTKKRMTDIPT